MPSVSKYDDSPVAVLRRQREAATRSEMMMRLKERDRAYEAAFGKPPKFGRRGNGWGCASRSLSSSLAEAHRSTMEYAAVGLSDQAPLFRRKNQSKPAYSRRRERMEGAKAAMLDALRAREGEAMDTGKLRKAAGVSWEFIRDVIDALIGEGKVAFAGNMDRRYPRKAYYRLAEFAKAEGSQP